MATEWNDHGMATECPRNARGTARGQRRLLTRLFFDRTLDNDLLSPRAGLEVGLAGVLAVVALPGLALPTFALLKYTYPFTSDVARDLASLGDKCLFVSLAMLALTGLASLTWDSLRPDERDYRILVPLPVGLTTLLEAKARALGLVFLVFTAAVMSAAPVVFPMVMLVTSDASTLEIARWMLAHVVSVAAAAAFAFFGMVALHGLLVGALGPRLFRRVSPWIQSAAVFATTVAFLLLPLIGSLTYPLKRAGGLALALAPQMWFVGMYQTLGGRGDPDWRRLAGFGALAVVSSVLLAAVTMWAGYRRHVSLTLEAAGARRADRPVARRVGAWLGHVAAGCDPGRHALLAFALRTMTRSPRHRMILAAFLGMGCAVSAVGLISVTWRRAGFVPPTPDAVMSVQNVLAFFVVAAAAAGASVPSDLAAGWVFRLLEGRDARAWLSGLRRAVVAGGIVPLLALLFPLHTALLGWPTALAHALVGLVMSIMLVELMLGGFRRAPFACAGTPGAGGPRPRWVAYWFGFSLYAFTLARVEAWAFDQPGGLMTLLGVGLAAVVALVVVRTVRPFEGTLAFDEPADWAMSRLDLTV